MIHMIHMFVDNDQYDLFVDNDPGIYIHWSRLC